MKRTARPCTILGSTAIGSRIPPRRRTPTAPAPAPRRARSRHVAPGAAAQVLPDFADLVEKYGPAVVNINTRTRAAAASSSCRASRRTIRSTSSSAASCPTSRPRRPGAATARGRRAKRDRSAARAAASLRPGLGLHRLAGRLHRHQRARGRERRGDHGALHRQARVQGQGDRRRYAQRRRRDQGRRDRPSGREDRRHQASCASANG